MISQIKEYTLNYTDEYHVKYKIVELAAWFSTGQYISANISLQC